MDGLVSSPCGGTLNNRQAASPFVRLVKGKRPLVTHQGVLPQNWGRTELNRTMTCMVLEATADDRHKILALHRNEFRGP
ncbi:hypothetical protein TNCV_602541 [Trichonephila clavipes]|nr:hypothetical protein TNCV_602541 [Trichonephila clavipes]